MRIDPLAFSLTPGKHFYAATRPVTPLRVISLTCHRDVPKGAAAAGLVDYRETLSEKELAEEMEAYNGGGSTRVAEQEEQNEQKSIIDTLVSDQEQEEQKSEEQLMKENYYDTHTKIYMPVRCCLVRHSNFAVKRTTQSG